MKYRIVPEACQEIEKEGKTVAPTFEGYVILDLPKYSAVSAAQREITLFIAQAKRKSPKKPTNDEADLDAVAVNIEAQEFTFGKLEPMLSEVKLKHLKSGFEIETIEDFVSFPACRPIIDELCLKLMFGFAEKN